MIALLCGYAGLLTWQLLVPFIRHVPVEPQTTASIRSAPIMPRAVLVARIDENHLFGDSTPAAQAPTLASSGSVSVIGIIYSPQAQDSVALLSVAGNSVVSHVGTQLSTGQTVTGILPDRVQLSGGSGSVNLLLDIKQADTDQRITPGQYAGVSESSDEPGNTAAPDGPPGASTAPAVTPQAGFAPTHYVSLKSLRGGAAMQRFQKMDMPAIPSAVKRGPPR